MDHHCPWMGNCVGLRTHKYFVCYLFWCVIACAHVAISTLVIATETAKDPTSINVKVNDYVTLNGSMAQVMCVGVSISVTIMLCMHQTLVLQNSSTLEFAELSLTSGGNPYDVGADVNYRQIMGPQCWQYLLPFYVGPIWSGKKNEDFLDGINYPRKPAPERPQVVAQADELQTSLPE